MSVSLPPLPRPNTAAGEPRRIGWELEFIGLSPIRAAEALREVFGGEITPRTEVELVLGNSELGDFRIEVDFRLLKTLHREAERQDSETARWSADLLASASRPLVPVEVVSPPLEMDALRRCPEAFQRLRSAGAKGTGQAVWYAFGLHLNVDAPDLEAATLRRYLQAFVCLQDWLQWHSRVDLSRRVTPYVKLYPDEYVSVLLGPDYRAGPGPDLDRLIADYLAFNPSRNRALDMLPLFAGLRPERVAAAVDDPRIKPRPAFHFRLPNSEIDRSGWDLGEAWSDWLRVEALASAPDQLKELLAALDLDRRRLTHRLDDRWRERIQDWLTGPGGPA